MRIFSLLIALNSLLLIDSPGPDTLELAQLKVHTGRLAQRVTELVGADDLIDTLHFGWFDRPYARASLAVLVKTTAMLQREVRLRELGNGAIPDSMVQAMLVWSDEALRRVITSDPVEGFRPHRLRVTADELTGTLATLPLYGFVDRMTATRRDRRFGDLDLMAAMGLRVYSILARDPVAAQTDDVVYRRAGALGMAVINLAERDALPGYRSLPPAASAAGSVLTVHPVTLRWMLQTGRDRMDAAHATFAVAHPVFGESPAASLARWGLARGVVRGARFMVDGWQVPRFGAFVEDRSSATAAAMWVSAVEGQSLGLIRGWRDLRDGSGSPYASALLDPDHVETIAHTALDLVRLGPYVSRFWTTPLLAVTIDPDAIDARNDNTWADWVEPIWAALLERQIRFDVVSSTWLSDRFRDRYDVVFPLRGDEVDDVASVMIRLERALAVVNEHVHRVTAREIDGTLATDVLMRDARTSDGRVYVAVVNLSGRPRSLKLRGGPAFDTLQDVVSGAVMATPNDHIDFAPWQARLLWPAEQ